MDVCRLDGAWNRNELGESPKMLADERDSFAEENAGQAVDWGGGLPQGASIFCRRGGGGVGL